MKKYLIYTLVAVFIGLTATAQIDRSKIPASGPTPEINLREAKEFKLDNGLTVLSGYRHKVSSRKLES